MFLASLVAAVGPIWLPFAFAREGRGAAYAFCLTNLVTLVPMIGTVAWGRSFPPTPSCRQLYSDAPCDGIPFGAALTFITLLFIALALWSLIASFAITTSDVYRKR